MSDEELLKAISSREFWRKYRNDEQNNNLDLYIKPIMISILKRTDELEKTLIVKGYLE